ncbi:MAG TPA: FliA/WhiG family RNA polymerase sigma factor [Vicinamibacterales bacterium]|nr:FliA/WhiG family RNA polymerase sigma factor [Vicinamibacterales bacterium]
MKISQAHRVEAGLPFVEALARRMAATMPHSIDLSDLVQDGVIGLIDAAHRFDDSRGIKFETFAERRIRGAMIDALRKDAWPRGVRRVRRELEAAREKLRASLGHEPSLADLAQAIGSDEKRLGKTIVRINTIESTSPFSSAENVDEAQLPAVLVPAEPERPDMQYERDEVKNRVRNAIATLPPREQRVIALYYYREVTMKDIGAELGVNESRVSQLHARAIRRLREALGAEVTPVAASAALRDAIAMMEAKPKMAKASLSASAAGGRYGETSPELANKLKPSVGGPESDTRVSEAAQKRAGLVLVKNNANRDQGSGIGDQGSGVGDQGSGIREQGSADQDNVSRAARSKSPNLKGLESQRQPVSSRKRSASVPATSPVTKMTRRASAGVAAAIAR